MIKIYTSLVWSHCGIHYMAVNTYLSRREGVGVGLGVVGTADGFEVLPHTMQKPHAWFPAKNLQTSLHLWCTSDFSVNCKFLAPPPSVPEQSPSDVSTLFDYTSPWRKGQSWGSCSANVHDPFQTQPPVSFINSSSFRVWFWSGDRMERKM